jgi:hypothetical protein
LSEPSYVESDAGAGPPLWTVQFLVEAPVEQVVQVEGLERRRVIQGQWWYRGVYAIEPDPRGTRLIYQVYNIARRFRWMVRFILLQYRLDGSLGAVRDGGMEALTRRLGHRLGCRAYRVEPPGLPALPGPARRSSVPG